MSCIRVGSVGIGGISRGVHLPGIEKSPDLKLVAVCDIDPEALRYAQEKYGIDDAHCFTDYHDLINCPDVDAVDLSLIHISMGRNKKISQRKFKILFCKLTKRE